jgi:hypothetical protein
MTTPKRGVTTWKPKGEHLEAKGGTLDLQIFVGKDTFSAPILCKLDNNNVCTAGSDAETFDQLRMWYAWMQYKRGFGESVIPRRLIRVDKVKVRCPKRAIQDGRWCMDGCTDRPSTRTNRRWVHQEFSAKLSTLTIWAAEALLGSLFCLILRRSPGWRLPPRWWQPELIMDWNSSAPGIVTNCPLSPCYPLFSR